MSLGIQGRPVPGPTHTHQIQGCSNPSYEMAQQFVFHNHRCGMHRYRQSTVYQQISYLKTDWYPELTQKSYNSVIKRQLKQQKMGQRKRHFSKENIQMSNKYVKRCSTSEINREAHIRTTMRHCVTPTRLYLIRKRQ